MLQFKRKPLELCLTLPILLWLGIIFWFSAQPAETSRELSGSLLVLISAYLSQLFQALQLDAQSIESFLRALSAIFRKLAHFFEYTVLGFILLRYLGNTQHDFWQKVFHCVKNALYFSKSQSRVYGDYDKYIWTLIFGISYAVSDEVHQHFVSGRSCELRDMLIDSAGICCGILLYSLYQKVSLQKCAPKMQY